MPRNLILQCRLSPGDVLTLTAAVESLHATYPGQYVTDVRTPTPAIWEYNPRITRRGKRFGVDHGQSAYYHDDLGP